MMKQPKMVVSFGISFFTSLIVILILYIVNEIEVESIYGSWITLPFAIMFIWFFSKQVDVVLLSTISSKKRVTASLFFIIRIILIIIPCVTLGVLRANDIWYDAFWGAIAIIGSLPIGFGIFTLLTSKERIEAHNIMHNYYFNQAEIGDEKDKPSKRAQKFLDKVVDNKGGD